MQRSSVTGPAGFLLPTSSPGFLLQPFVQRVYVARNRSLFPILVHYDHTCHRSRRCGLESNEWSTRRLNAPPTPWQLEVHTIRRLSCCLLASYSTMETWVTRTGGANDNTKLKEKFPRILSFLCLVFQQNERNIKKAAFYSIPLLSSFVCVVLNILNSQHERPRVLRASTLSLDSHHSKSLDHLSFAFVAGILLSAVRKSSFRWPQRRIHPHVYKLQDKSNIYQHSFSDRVNHSSNFFYTLCYISLASVPNSTLESSNA